MTERIDDRTSELKKAANELRKQYLIFDGSSRLIELYEATTGTQEGEPCSLTRYAYVGATTIVNKREEVNSIWPAGADIP
jgi:hypothetical protein